MIFDSDERFLLQKLKYIKATPHNIVLFSAPLWWISEIVCYCWWVSFSGSNSARAFIDHLMREEPVNPEAPLVLYP